MKRREPVSGPRAEAVAGAVLGASCGERAGTAVGVGDSGQNRAELSEWTSSGASPAA